LERDGAKVGFDVYENDAPTIFLLPTWQILHSHHWKFQIAFLARHFRVITYDAVGNGLSDRPSRADRYTLQSQVDDTLAVLDATNTERCIVVGFSAGGGLAIAFAAQHAARVEGIVALAPYHPWGVPNADRAVPPPTAEGEVPQGWAKYSPDYWKEDWKDFVEFFIAQVWSDPHSTKGWDDSVGWALETTGETIALTAVAGLGMELATFEAAVRGMDVPTLILHGSGDQIVTHESSVVLQSMIAGSELLTLDGVGHALMGRYPVRVNLAIESFSNRILNRPWKDVSGKSQIWNRGYGRKKKVLYVSSPIGLGHARRDVAIAQELRTLHSDVQIDWLAQDPLTRVLADAGETVHPASGLLSNESAHIEAECGEHALNAFLAIRNMDEILLKNFMLFNEVIRDGQYDLVVGDEAWEIDFHLHENPNLKKTAFAWMTDFVGFLPMESGGEREALVAADYNAEMIEQVRRYRRIRDVSIFVGETEDIVKGTFGPGLPNIQSWVEEHFEFSGYVTGFDPSTVRDRDALRAELGFRSGERVCIVSVGGSGVGADLIRQVVRAYPEAERLVPGLRMIVVTGPRLDPEVMPQMPGVEYLSYVSRLYRHLAAADLAIVQGGLTTTMELTACKVPFIYVPLRDHFEQNFHVRARLNRYGAGVYMDYEDVVPEKMASMIAQQLNSTPAYLDVESDGAARAAAILGGLL